SLMRSAEASVFCSRCCRCSRTLAYPSRAKINTMAPSNNKFSFTPSVGVNRNQASRFGSVSCMLQHRRCDRYSFFWLSCTLKSKLFLREDRQILHRHPEQSESGSDDHAGDRQFTPLRKIAHARRSFESRDAHVHPVRDESQDH